MILHMMNHTCAIFSYLPDRISEEHQNLLKATKLIFDLACIK